MSARRRASTRPSPSPTVAVVEDDASARRALGRILRAHGLRVWCFSSAEELLQAWETVLPSCLVVDVVLPGMSGPDLVERLRTGREPPPSIFVTGRIDALPALRQRGLGDVPCLQKPFEPAALLQAVSHALERVSARPA